MDLLYRAASSRGPRLSAPTCLHHNASTTRRARREARPGSAGQSVALAALYAGAGPVAGGSVTEYVYSMYRADKFYGADRQVLANISLSFLHGAKIGVLGPNGAGKSTLLRIMAGREETSSGEAQLAPGATVGLLEQEPELDPAKDVRGNVEDGVRELRDLLDRFNAISAAFAEPDADYDALLAEQAKVQDEIDRRDAWSLDATLDRAMDALRLPDGDRDVTTLSGGERRRVALCRLLLSAPDLLLLDEPTNHLDAESVAWLERFLADYKGAVIAVTHDRYFLDNVAGWILELDRGRGIPFQGNYSSWLEQKQARLAVEEKQESARRRTLARELEWVRMSPRARQAKSKARLGAYEQLLAEEQRVKLDRVEIHIPSGPAARRRRDRGRRAREGLRRPAPVRGPRLLAAAGRDRRRDRPERRRQDDALPDDRGRGAARRGHAPARRDGRARLRRPVARRARPEEHGLEGDQRRPRHDRARQARGELAPVRELVQLPRRRPAEAGRPALGRRAQPRPPREAAARAAATCSCSTSRPTTSTSTRCARSRRRCSTSPAAPS